MLPVDFDKPRPNVKIVCVIHRQGCSESRYRLRPVVVSGFGNGADAQNFA